MSEIILQRIEKLINNITYILSLINSFVNSEITLGVVSSKTILDLVSKSLNYYAFLINYINIKTKNNSITKTFVNEFIESITKILNDYSLYVSYIIYLQNNLTTNYLLYLAFEEGEIKEKSVEITDINSSGYLLILSDNYEKLKELFIELQYYVKLILESKSSNLPIFFNKYTKYNYDKQKETRDRFINKYNLYNHNIKDKDVKEKNNISSKIDNMTTYSNTKKSSSLNINSLCKTDRHSITKRKYLKKLLSNNNSSGSSLKKTIKKNFTKIYFIIVFVIIIVFNMKEDRIRKLMKN